LKLEADLHVHTIASGHGYSTVKEIAQAASEIGLKMIAITDHGPHMPGGPHLYHFTNMISLPSSIYGVEILRGIEANILDANGSIDIPRGVADYLDLVLAGFHDATGYNGQSKEENTESMIAAIKNPSVHIISHPGNPIYPVDIDSVVMAAKQYNKALEINNYSYISRPGSNLNCIQFAKLCAKHNVWVAINSDAHFCSGVGKVDHALEMALKAGIKRQQIVNAYAYRVNEFINQHLKRCNSNIEVQNH
jgi:putative hydrolase